jgi:hypothetical protein
MPAGLSPAQPARARYRHDLRTLIYVTLDQDNGGIIWNLSHEGIAVQAVAAVSAGQQLQVRFELPPRLRVEVRGEVMWADPSGRCGIRFLDLSPRLARRVDEWIMGNLLESVPMHAPQEESARSPLFSLARLTRPDKPEDDGLIVSPSPVKVIELPTRPDPGGVAATANHGDASPSAAIELDWLSRPLSRRSIVWLINSLALVAALLLFTLVFLAVTREVPRWPAAMAAGESIAVAALYWGFFKLFGGASPGARLARLVGGDAEGEGEPGQARFR